MTMLQLLIALAVLASSAECEHGTLSYYAAAPTRAVIANRSVPWRTAHTLPANHADYDGYIAVLDCDRIGEVVDVRWNGHTARLVIFDCAGDAATRAWMRSGNVIGEVSFDVAKRWRVIGRGMRNATVCEAMPQRYIRSTIASARDQAHNVYAP